MTASTSDQSAPTPDASVRVPELVGVPAAEAHDRALDAGVLAVPENASHTGAGRAPIGKQEPEAGSRVEPGSAVKIWISTDTSGPA